MAHVNQQLRDAVKAALQARAEIRTVAAGQASDLLDADMPAVVVATAADQVEPWSKGPPVQEVRTVALTVVVVIEGDPDTIEDSLDALRVIVEPEVVTAVASLARHVRHTGSELDVGTDEDGERWFAFLALSWEVEIVTAVGNPEAALL